MVEQIFKERKGLGFPVNAGESLGATQARAVLLTLDDSNAMR